MTMSKQARGFTLIEAMVVVAVMSIVAVFAIPSINGLVVTSRLGTQADELVHALMTAKNEAVTRRRNVYVVFDVAAGVTTGWKLRYDNATTGDLIRSDTVRTPVEVARSPSNRQTFYFTPTGAFFQADSAPFAMQPMDFKVCDGDSDNEKGRTVKVTAFGNISNMRHANSTGCQP